MNVDRREANLCLMIICQAGVPTSADTMHQFGAKRNPLGSLMGESLPTLPSMCLCIVCSPKLVFSYLN